MTKKLQTLVWKHEAIVRFLLATFVACFFLPRVVRADTDDDTLAYFLAKSELVVIGTITDEPLGLITEVGVVEYACNLEVADVLKSNRPFDDESIAINIVRFERNNKDCHPLVKRNAKCIVFLKKEPEGTRPAWVTSDFWFGIQPPSASMARSLKRVAGR